jgi:aminopeptidase N
MIPPVDQENKYTHKFIAHETAHQWWGNIVAWRSYRDQWLSEGFAEYSGLLYAGNRDREGQKAAADLIRELRESLRNPPRTATGLGGGRLNDIGPIVLGLRLNTSKSIGAYQALIYNKGALVLRMLHFLMSNPANLDDAAFPAMMKDFVERYRNGAASTEQFMEVASQHFARTPIAQKFGLRDLNWFFRQWVYGTELPVYTLEYEIKTSADGATMISGVVKQDSVSKDWLMVLPVVFTFEGNQEARTALRAAGPSTPFELKLPMKPKKVELDPASWVLSEKTLTRGK